MLDMPIDQLITLIQTNAPSGLAQNILLILIWLNVRSLKLALNKLEDGHDKRIGALEVREEKHETRLTVLEINRGKQ